MRACVFIRIAYISFCLLAHFTIDDTHTHTLTQSRVGALVPLTRTHTHTYDELIRIVFDAVTHWQNSYVARAWSSAPTSLGMQHNGMPAPTPPPTAHTLDCVLHIWTEQITCAQVELEYARHDSTRCAFFACRQIVITYNLNRRVRGSRAVFAWGYVERVHARVCLIQLRCVRACATTDPLNLKLNQTRFAKYTHAHMRVCMHRSAR